MGNHISVTGFICADAKTVPYNEGTKTLIAFNLADHNRWKDKAGTEHDVVTWWKVKDWRGKDITKTLTKGKMVTVEGSFRPGKPYTRKDGTTGLDNEIHVTSILTHIRPDQKPDEKTEENAH